MRFLPLLLIALAFACDRPVVVDANPNGAESLPLRGANNISGTLTKALRIGEKLVPKGTRFVVIETWIIRKDKAAKPPSYRITGYYDVATRADGFALPQGATEVYYLSKVLPARVGQVPVPATAFRKDP